MGFALIGRKDLPLASRAIGKHQQVGHIAGMVQGARLRADRYASDNYFKQCQNEFLQRIARTGCSQGQVGGKYNTASCSL